LKNIAFEPQFLNQPKRMNMENAINTVNKIDFEFIQWYEIDAEICWLNYGLLKDLWEVDHTIFFIVEIS